MNPNVPMYSMQMGDGYTKYYSQTNHLPYTPYNSAPKPYSQLQYSTPSLNPESQAPSHPSLQPQNPPLPSIGPRYHAPSNMYPKFPVQDLTGRPLMQPHSGLPPSTVSYTPVSPKTTTGNTVMFMNCSPDMYKKPPTPPGSYRSPGSTPPVFGSSTGTTRQSPLLPLYDETIFKASNKNHDQRTSTPPQSVEDKFKAKASQYGIEISSTVEQFLKSQEKEHKHTTVPKVSKSDPTLDHHKMQQGDALNNFQQKALTNGIIMEDPREKVELRSKEKDQIIMKCPNEFCGAGEELLDDEERNSCWNRSNSVLSASSKHSESQEDSFEEEVDVEKGFEENVKSLEIGQQTTESNQLVENNDNERSDLKYLEDLAKELVNDAILGALKDLRIEDNKRNQTDKATSGNTCKLYSWPMKMKNNNYKTDNNQTDSNNNGSVPPGVIAACKPLLRSVLDPGSPEFMPKEKTSFPLNTGSQEFIPSTGNGAMPCFSFVSSVYESDGTWPKEQRDTSFNPTQHIHTHSVGQSYYSKNASCQTWLDPMVDASCNTPQVKLKNQSIETVTCDSREVGINTMETFECDDDDTIIIPLNDLRCRLADTQRELLLLRGRVCLDEMERQLSSLEKSRDTWTSYFDLEDADLEELIDLQITTLKKKILCHLEKIRDYEERLDSGEILTEVPCFESIVTSNSKVGKLVNKKKMDSLQKRSQELSRHSIEKAASASNIDNRESVVELEASNKSRENSPTDEMTNLNPTKSDSQIARKKTKDKSKKKAKSGGKSQVKEGQSKVKDSGEVQSVNRGQHLADHTQQQISVDNGNLSTPEDVAQFLQHEWELAQVQNSADDAVPMSTSIENVLKTDNLQQPQKDESVINETQMDYVTKSSSKSEVSISSINVNSLDDILPSSIGNQDYYDQACNTNKTEALSNISQTQHESKEENLSTSEQTEVCNFQMSSTSLETNELVTKNFRNVERQVKDQANVPVNDVSFGPAKQAMQNLSSEENTPASLVVNDMMGSNPDSQVSNPTAIQQALPESGVALDPILFEAVKAQIAQVYPAFAADPTVLNSIALQQTMVLQACVASGGNLGITETQPVVDSEKVDTWPKLEKEIPSESSTCQQEKDTFSCVQPLQHKETTEFSLETSIPTLASGAIPKHVSSYQNSGITANPLPTRKEFDTHLEQFQDIAPPPGISVTPITNISGGSKPLNFSSESKTCDPYRVPSIQSGIEGSTNLHHVNQPDPATLNTQSAFIPPLISKPLDANCEQAPVVSECSMKSNDAYFANKKLMEEKANIGPKSSSFTSKGEYIQTKTVTKEKLSQKQFESSLDSISDKISSIDLSAGTVGGSPNIVREDNSTQKILSKMDTLNLDEIDDDDDEDDEKEFAIKSKESQDVFNQWQKPLLTKRESTPPLEETKPNQQGMQKLGSVLHTRRAQLEKGSLRDWMKKDTEVEVGGAVDQLDQISFDSDRQKQLAVQARPQGQPRLSKETTPEGEESWTQVTKKGKKKEISQPPPTVNPHPPINPLSKLSATSAPCEKSNNFERLVQRLGEIFAGLSREELISVITSVRKQRGGLSGLTVKDIVADARVFATRLMKNKNKLVTQAFCDFSMPFQKNQERPPPRDDEEICIICHDGLSCEEVKKLECGHVFHAGCIKQWVYGREMTCPTCRRLVLFPEEFPKLGK